MPKVSFRNKWIFTLLALLALCARGAEAQTTVRDRLSQPIRNTSPVAIHGNVHPLARPEFDRGPVESDFVLSGVTMVFKSTDEQQNNLDALLEEQQDPSSPNYQKWVTPEEFADQFGLSAADMAKVSDWLKAQGFQVDQVARGRRFVVFSGSARNIELTFGTQIHRYVVNGETHYANASDPSVPGELGDLVLGFNGMNDFRPKPRTIKAKPHLTQSGTGYHFIAPADFAVIYDLKPLYAEGINGSGQSIAIAGQTDISLTDIREFRSAANLTAKDPQIILASGSKDPGTSQDDLPEADLDIEWSGAVATSAQIIYVNSTNANDLSLAYAIDQNLAPIVSTSYGECEADAGSDARTIPQLGQQANAQGQTLVTAAGDQGATDCEGDFSNTTYVATTGLAVDIPGSTPYFTSVGGTEFNDGMQGGAVFSSSSQAFGNFFNVPSTTYWSSTNGAGSVSAQSYIPEMVWNDTPEGFGISAGGGGKSTLFTKPTWQVAPGVPSDGARDVPDISFSASPNVDPYLECTGGSCSSGFANVFDDAVGGTSVAAPSFAGVVALINQTMNARQGNVNPNLYRLFTSAPSAFHDIVISGNAQPCENGSVDCPASGIEGYAAVPGYDLASGLGSLDIANLVNAWAAVSGSAQAATAAPSQSPGP